MWQLVATLWVHDPFACRHTAKPSLVDLIVIGQANRKSVAASAPPHPTPFTTQTYSITAVRQAHNLEEVIVRLPCDLPGGCVGGSVCRPGVRWSCQIRHWTVSIWSIMKPFTRSNMDQSIQEVESSLHMGIKDHGPAVSHVNGPLLYREACLPAICLPASLHLGILQNKHITNVGRFKSFRNHIRLIDKTSTALFRNNSKSAYARHSFSTTPPPYVATATSLLHLSNVRNGPMGSMDQWIIGWGSGITRTSFLLFFVGMLSRYRLQCTLQPCRGGSMLFRTHISCISVAFLGIQVVQHPPFFLGHSLCDNYSKDFKLYFYFFIRYFFTKIKNRYIL